MKVPSTKLSRELARRRLLAFAGAGLVSSCGGGSSSLGVGDRASGGRKVLYVLVDGLGPDYLRLSDTPNLDRMIREGDYREGPGVIPVGHQRQQRVGSDRKLPGPARHHQQLLL